MLIIPVGPSCSGKSTLMKGLENKLPSLRRMPSYTTREPRPNADEPEYVHVSLEEFESRAQAGEFAWKAAPHGGENRYGTLKSDFEKAVADDSLWIAILTVEAAEEAFALTQAKGRISPLILLQLLIDDEFELRDRFKKRGDSHAEMLRRLDYAKINQRIDRSRIPFQIINARQSPEAVLRRALEYIDRRRR